MADIRPLYYWHIEYRKARGGLDRTVIAGADLMDVGAWFGAFYPGCKIIHANAHPIAL